MSWQPGDPVSLKGHVSETHCCIDCGFNTAPGFKTRAELEVAFAALADLEDGVEQSFTPDSELYIVRDRIWAEAEMEPWGGCLCIGCLEQRLGRHLKPKDFLRDHPFNRMPGTARLLKRRGKTRPL